MFDGKPVAYFHKNSIYTFQGSHIGRFEDGWIRDNDGYCVFFTPDAKGGPIKPVKRVKPVKSVKQVKPVKSVKQIAPVKKVNKLSWSSYSTSDFFDNY